MTNSEITDDLDEDDSMYATTGGDEINFIEASNEWSEWRDQLAHTMFSDWELRDHWCLNTLLIIIIAWNYFVICSKLLMYCKMYALGILLIYVILVMFTKYVILIVYD